MRVRSQLIVPTLATLGAFLCVLAMSASPSLAQSQKLIKQCVSGIPDKVISGCSKLIGMRGFSQRDRSSMFLNRALAWQEKEEFDKGLADIDEAIRLRPDANSYFTRGNLLTGKGELDSAIAAFDEASRLAPRDYRSFLNRGNARFDKGDKEGALTEYEIAIRLNPKFALSYNARASVWREAGDYDRSLSDLNHAIRLDPKIPTLFSNRADTWRLKGDLDRALVDADRAIKSLPKAPLFLCRRGEILRYKGELANSITAYDAAILNETNFAMAYTGRGLTYEKMGDLVRARADFEKALTVTEFYDSNASAQETARARLAALNAGEPQQSASAATPATGQAASPSSLPTHIAIPPGRRIALVIGNSAYKAVPALPNPQRDAEAIATALRSVGFETVIVSSDATREQLMNALRLFADEADKSDWAMVYYAGHGLEVGGVNYLIPVDARLATDRDVQLEAVSIDQVLVGVEGAKRLKLIVLDACRDNPFIPQMRRTATPELTMGIQSSGTSAGTRSVGRGLAEVKPQGAMLVVFAAKHGQLALDGESANSPFATAFVQRVATPGVELNKLIRLVRDDVMEATAGRQEPFTYGSLPGREDFFFVAGQ